MTKYLVLPRGEETYLFFYDQESVSELLRTLRSFDENPDLSFGGYDYERCRRKVLGYENIPFGSLTKQGKCAMGQFIETVGKAAVEANKPGDE